MENKALKGFQRLGIPTLIEEKYYVKLCKKSVFFMLSRPGKLQSGVLYSYLFLSMGLLSCQSLEGKAAEASKRADEAIILKAIICKGIYGWKKALK